MKTIRPFSLMDYEFGLWPHSLVIVIINNQTQRMDSQSIRPLGLIVNYNNQGPLSLTDSNLLSIAIWIQLLQVQSVLNSHGVEEQSQQELLKLRDDLIELVQVTEGKLFLNKVVVWFSLTQQDYSILRCSAYLIGTNP